MTRKRRTAKERTATVRVALTQYGKAAYIFHNAASHADFCEHPTGEFTARFNGHNRCGSLAKFKLQGMKVCGKHAAFLLLRAAYEAGMKPSARRLRRKT